MAKEKPKEEDRVLKRECDEPMAKKKGYLPCRKQCSGCHACIEITSTERRHCVPRKN